MPSLRSTTHALRRSLPSKERLRFWLAKTTQFGMWQALSQGLQFITGLLIVRWLTHESYAKYTFALGFQNMLTQLVDLGFSGSILALVGQRIQDPKVVGRYMSAAAHQRNTLLLLVAPVSLPFFLWYGCKHDWSVLSGVLLFGSVIAFLFCQGWVSIYSPSLLMRQHVAGLYRPGVILSAARLAILQCLSLLSVIGAVVTCWINALTAMVTALLYRSASKPFHEMPAKRDAEAEKEMRRYLTPLLAGMIFFAFHGQIQLWLIAFFGTTKSMAEVGALGRLGQMFIFFSSFISTMLVPFIARVPLERVAVRYVQAVVGLFLLGGCLSAGAFLFPRVLLILLGDKYANLQLEVGLSVTVAALGMITAAIYSFNNARKWVFHLTAITSIGGLVILETLMIAFMDLSTTHGVMLFSIVATAYPILPFGFAAFQGYRRSMAEARAAALAANS